MWLLMHAGIKLNHVSKRERGPRFVMDSLLLGEQLKFLFIKFYSPTNITSIAKPWERRS